MREFDFPKSKIHKDEYDHHIRKDPHQQASALSDIILGGQDGLVNVLGVILGVAAATGDPYIVLVAGLAATFAESVSMAAVAYTSTIADADYYESEMEREYRHIKEVPNLEREEIRSIYAEKGFSGGLLERIVETITASPDVWVAVMMSEEHQIQPVNRKIAFRSAIIVGIAAIIGSLIPLLPFLFTTVSLGILLSIGCSALVLFIVGVVKARMTVGSPGKSGLEMAVIGTVSALVGYGVGALLKAPSVP
ncbi:MAG: VIT1/CCC1 transporter family protein [Chloroflexota bacterium]|nr:MAG: VIT1/CCC1 transporter family protein [Chloroflexota bacterium]